MHRTSAKSRLFAMLMASPMALWQIAFFASAFAFLVTISFWKVVNFEITPAFSLSNWSRVLSAGYFLPAYQYTTLMALLTAAIGSLLAFPASYWMAFGLSRRAQNTAVLLLIIPFFSSYLVRLYAWRLIVTDEGVLNVILQALDLSPRHIINTSVATVVGYLTMSFPLILLLQYFSLSNIDRTLIGAAQNLGCRPFAIVYRIIIPLSKTGITLAAVFAFILAFGDFMSPSLLGGNKPPTLGNLMIDAVKSGNNYPRAAVVALMMIATLCIASVAALSYVYGRKKG